MGAYRRLQEERDKNNREKFAERSARARLTITRIDTDSLGNARQAWGTEDGAGEFPIMSMGHAIEIGEVIIGEREGGNVANPSYRYVAHLESDAPAAGLLRLEPGPPPNFATVWHTERIETINGASFARITIYFQIDPSFSPSKVYVSHKPSTAPDWTDQAVPFIMTAADQAAEIAVPYASGINVDIQLTAEYQYAYSPSTPSSTRVVTTPTDGVTPGAVSGLTVDTSIPGILKLKAAGTFDRSRYIGVRYEIATAIGGPPIATPVVDGEYEYYAAAGGTFYVAAAPISRSNVLGTRYPGVSTFSGPYTVAVAAAAPDNTAPAAWGAPTVTNFVRQRADGSQAAFIRIAFPVRGTYEPDYAATGIRLWNGTTYDERTIPYRGSPPDTQEYQVDFGTWTVWIYAIDASQNKSALSTSASTTITPLGIPPLASDPVIRQIGLANEVTFTAPTGAETVQVERSDDAAGTVNVVTVYEGKGTSYLDLHTELTTFPQVYYYRVRGRNFAGDGTWSSRIIGTIAALSGTVVAANTLQGDRVIANTLDANTIKTNTILTALLKTANAGNTRWELEGATGFASAMQFRGIEFVGGSDKKRVQIDGTGFFVYNDAAAQEGKFYRDSSTHARFSMGIDSTYGTPAVDVKWDTTATKWASEYDLYRTFMRFNTLSEKLEIKDNNSAAGYAARPLFFDPTIASGKPVAQFQSSGGPVLSVFGDGLEVFQSPNSYGLTVNSGRWQAAEFFGTAGLHAGVIPSYYSAYPITARPSGTLGNTGGDFVPIAAYQYLSGNNISVLHTAYRGQTIGTSDWQDARHLWLANVDNGAVFGGGLQLGFRAYTPFFALSTGTTSRLFWDDANARVQIPNTLRVDVAFTCPSKTFVIPHPDPAKTATHELRHSATEGPTRGDNLYTYGVSVQPDAVSESGFRVQVVDSEGKEVKGVTIDKSGDVCFPLPDYWPFLNERPRAFTENAGDGWGRAKARVNAALDTVTFRREDEDEGGEWIILLIGTRKDRHAMENWNLRGVEKRNTQKWTADITIERRAAKLAARAAKAERTKTSGGTRTNLVRRDLRNYVAGSYRIEGA